MCQLPTLGGAILALQSGQPSKFKRSFEFYQLKLSSHFQCLWQQTHKIPILSSIILAPHFRPFSPSFCSSSPPLILASSSYTSSFTHKLAPSLVQTQNWGRIHKLLFLLVLLGIIRVSILLINMMMFNSYLTCYGWLNMETFGLGWKSSEKLKEKLKQICWKLNPKRCPYGGVHGLFCGHQNLMKPFLMILDIHSFPTI